MIEHVKKHGDGVKILLFGLKMLKIYGKKPPNRGAKSYMEPIVEKDEDGEVVRSGIYTYGETVHMFVERKNYNGDFLPGFQKWESDTTLPLLG